MTELILATGAFLLTHFSSLVALATFAWMIAAYAGSNLPFAAVAQGRNRVVWSEIGALRPAIGLGAFALALGLHGGVFGVRPY